MRLIDADALEKAMYGSNFYGDGCAAATHYADCVRNAPTIEAEPVRHGYWAIRPSGWSAYDCVCSKCGESGTPDYKYCHNCGARMDGGISDGINE